MEYTGNLGEREPLIGNTTLTTATPYRASAVLTGSKDEQYDQCISPAPQFKQAETCSWDNDRTIDDPDKSSPDSEHDTDISKSSPCSCNPSRLCDSSSSTHQYMFLVFICIIGVGDYFCVDEPAALQSHMLEDLDITETQYMCFYSNIQWSGIVSCLCGGYLIDKVFGNRLGLSLFTFLLTLSHLLFAGGALMNSYWTMFVARAAYGLFEGPAAIANDNMAVKWFQTTNINFVLGLKTSIARVSSVVNINVMSSIYDYWNTLTQGHTSLGLALFTGVMVCCVSVVSSVIVAVLDKKADTIKYTIINTEYTEEEKTISIKDVKDFPVQYWLVTFITAVYYLALFPFVGLGQVFFIMKYNKAPSVADNVNSMVYLMAGITMPIFGYLIDKFGHSMMWMFLGNTLSVTSHVLLAFTFLEPYIATVTLGIGYSIFTATVWPMCSYIIPLKYLGTAYGLMNAIIAVGQAGVAYMAGYIVDNYGYLVLQVLFIASMSASLILGSCLYLIDTSRNGILNLNGKDRTARLELSRLPKKQPSENRNDPHIQT